MLWTILFCEAFYLWSWWDVLMSKLLSSKCINVLLARYLVLAILLLVFGLLSIICYILCRLELPRAPPWSFIMRSNSLFLLICYCSSLGTLLLGKYDALRVVELFLCIYWCITSGSASILVITRSWYLKAWLYSSATSISFFLAHYLFRTCED